MSIDTPAPDHATLADLYLQLDRLQRAGLPIVDSLAKVATPASTAHIKAVQAHLRRGLGLAEAGRRAGLFLGIDAALLAAGELRGDYPFAELAKRHRSAFQHRRAMRRKLLLPAALLTSSLLLAPLPELVAGTLTLAGYLGKSLGVLALLGIGVSLLVRLPALARRFGLGPGFDAFALRLPLFGPLLKRRALLEFSRALGLLLRAGLPLFEALPAATAVVVHDGLQQRLDGVEQTLRSGSSFAQALAEIADLDASLVALVSSGEQAGRLDDMLLHYVELEEAGLDADEAALVDWLGRSVYLLVVIWVAASLIGVGGPPDYMEEVRRMERGG